MIRGGYQPAPKEDPRIGENPPQSGSGLNNKNVTIEINTGGNYLRHIHSVEIIVKFEKGDKSDSV